jgi:hypothetical protein
LLVEIGKDWDIQMTGPVEGVYQGYFHKDLMEKILSVS